MGSANQKAEITAAGSWPATQGLKTELSEKAAETLLAVMGRMFVFHLLQGTAHPPVLSHLKARLGLLFRTDSEERVPLSESSCDFPQFWGFP